MSSLQGEERKQSDHGSSYGSLPVLESELPQQDLSREGKEDGFGQAQGSVRVGESAMPV